MALSSNTRRIARQDPVLAFKVAIMSEEDDDDAVAQLFLDLPELGVSEMQIDDLTRLLERERPMVAARLRDVALALAPTLRLTDEEDATQ